MTKLSREEISHALIARGSLRHLLHDGQKKFYDLIKNNPLEQELFLMAARRFGKSYMLAILGVEHCLTEPQARVRHVFPVLTTGKKALFDIMGQIVNLLPSHLRPKLNRTEATYTFPNGAMYMVGSAMKTTMDNLRGTATTMLLADECAFWDIDVFDEVLYSILYPQMLHYSKRKAVFITTPPPTITHPAIEQVLHRVKERGFYFAATVHDNPRISPEEIERMCHMVGGPESNAWRREFLVELIASDEYRLVPDFDEELHVKESKPVDSFGNRMHVEPYIGVDLGLVDESAYVGGYYDFVRQKFVVTCEKTCTYTAFPELYQHYVDMVDTYFKTDDGFFDPTCVLDVFPIAAHDLRTTYGWAFRNPRKGKVQETISYLRDCFANDKVEVHPSCKKLIYQLNVAIWDESREKIARNADQSHADLLMALSYLLKEVPWNTRPGDQIALKFNRISGRRK